MNNEYYKKQIKRDKKQIINTNKTCEIKIKENKSDKYC